MRYKDASCFHTRFLQRRYLLVIMAAAGVVFYCSTGYAQQAKSTKAKTDKNATVKKGPANKDMGTYIAPQMIFVKSGSFTMGDNNRLKETEADERPEHKVTLDDFWIGRYEVTVAEFRKFMDTHTYVTEADKQGFSWCFDGKSLIYKKQGSNWETDVYGNKHVNEEDHPVTHVSQDDALAYCKWLSEQTGKKYRLLTEAEWEYAAKGGPHHDTFEFSGSNNMEEVGWYAWNSDFQTHPVGAKKPNSLGVYDMSGNVWEWCSDLYGPYKPEDQTNPRGADTSSYIALRGGGWRYDAIRCRCTTRRGMLIGFNGSGPGFRLAATKQ